MRAIRKTFAILQNCSNIAYATLQYRWMCISYLKISSVKNKKVSVIEVILVRISCIQSKCGKMRTRITPNTDTFHFSILTSNDLKLKVMESLLIARNKAVLNKADSSLPLLFWCNISGYRIIFYHIIWCPSISLYVYNCLFSFQYYVTSFSTLSKTKYISI